MGDRAAGRRSWRRNHAARPTITSRSGDEQASFSQGAFADVVIVALLHGFPQPVAGVPAGEFFELCRHPPLQRDRPDFAWRDPGVRLGVCARRAGTASTMGRAIARKTAGTGTVIPRPLMDGRGGDELKIAEASLARPHGNAPGQRRAPFPGEAKIAATRSFTAMKLYCLGCKAWLDAHGAAGHAKQAEAWPHPVRPAPWVGGGY